MCKDGRSITSAPNQFVRNVLRQQSIKELKTKITQGNLAIMKYFIYCRTLDKAFTSCVVPPHFERFLIAEDSADSTDLSCILFRMQRAIGGAWAEYLHIGDEPPCH